MKVMSFVSCGSVPIWMATRLTRLGCSLFPDSRSSTERLLHNPQFRSANEAPSAAMFLGG